MDFSSDANANFEGLLAVNREICMTQMAEKTSPDAPPNCAVVPLTKRTKCCILYAAKAFVLYRKECFFMRKILSLLLILALFLPCALAETPQGIDLALTSTYGDGLSLRMTAGLGETPFCSLTLPSGQIDLAFSPDKGLCVQSGGQWAQLLVEGHPVDAALLTTPLKLLDGRSPSEVLGLLAEDVNKMLDAIPSLYNLPMTLIRDPAFARLFSDLYIAAQTGTVSITSEELNRLAASVLGKIYSMEYLDGLNFSDIYHNLLASVVQSSGVARAYRSLSNFRLSGQIGIDKGELLFSQPYQEPYYLTYEQTTPNSWHYLLTTANSDTIDGVLYWRNEYDFALSGYSENQHTAFSVTCSYGSANNFVFIASVDNSFSLSIVQAGSNFSLRLDNKNTNVFALESTSDYIRVKIYSNYYTLTIAPATDGLDIVAQARTFGIFTAHVRTALNGLICTGVYGDTTYRLALTETATGFSLLLSLPDGDFHLDFAALSDTSCSLTFTDAAGQQVSLTGSLCTPESPVIPEAIGTIELTQLLDGLF